MILDPRALWTREDIAEYLQVSTKQVDLMRHRMPQPLMIGRRLPRWQAGDIMEWVRQHSGNALETRASA